MSREIVEIIRNAVAKEATLPNRPLETALTIAKFVAPEIERLLAQEREKAIAWGRVDQHKEDCQDVDCKYASIQGKIIKGCPKYLALQRQLDLTKDLVASSREEGGDAK